MGRGGVSAKFHLIADVEEVRTLMKQGLVNDEWKERRRVEVDERQQVCVSPFVLETYSFLLVGRGMRTMAKVENNPVIGRKGQGPG